MLRYAAIVPHSPLFLAEIAGPSPVAARFEQAFQTLAEELHRRSIHRLILVSSHPRFERNAFSVYVAHEYAIDFSDFGNLVTHSNAELDWSAYHALREFFQSDLEPITQEKVDYGHGVPLLKLHASKQSFTSLCLNDYGQASVGERNHFGQRVRTVLDASSEPTAVICSGDLFQAKDPDLLTEAHKQNDSLRQRLAQNVPGNLSFPDSPQQLSAPCVLHPLQILSGLLHQTSVQYEEFLFEHTPQTSILFAGYSL